jgi:hypothetical protein
MAAGNQKVHYKTARRLETIGRYRQAIAIVQEEHEVATFSLLAAKLGIEERIVTEYVRKHPELKPLMKPRAKVIRRKPEERREIVFVPKEAETITCSVWHCGAGRPCLETVSRSVYNDYLHQKRIEKTFTIVNP